MPVETVFQSLNCGLLSMLIVPQFCNDKDLFSGNSRLLYLLSYLLLVTLKAVSK
jgi:hypothetical protein